VADDWLAPITDPQDTLDRLKGAVADVVGLHRPGMTVYGRQVCEHCYGLGDVDHELVYWPCETVRTIRKRLGIREADGG